MMTTILGTICCIRTVESYVQPSSPAEGSSGVRAMAQDTPAAVARFNEVVRCTHTIL